jgi:hypothetical protein
MSEDFLSRWSRRKQAAAQAPDQAKPGAESAAGPDRAPDARDPSAVAEGAARSSAPAFDPASLPPLESITAETDIRAFFAAGVPAELTRAALRRVWTADPKIRDFVGLADYDWDFNAPGSMAGFGPLEGADALRAQMARRLGPLIAENDSDAASDQGAGPAQEMSASDQLYDPQSQPTQIPVTTKDEPSQICGAPQQGAEPTRPDREFVAAQQQEKPDDIQSIARRRHGRALPEA